MFGNETRRDFLAHIRFLAPAGAIAAGMPQKGRSATSKRPHDFTIVEGHRDIWEISGRTRLPQPEQHLPITNFISRRLIDAGMTVCIIPAGGGDSLEERDGNEQMLEGNLRVLDMILTDLDHCKGTTYIIRTKSDVPAGPTPGKVAFFLDMEGGSGLQTNLPEPEFPPDRSLGLLRNFFRLGVRGLQLTHNGRNQLGDGRAIDKAANRLTPFGVAVVKEMNRLGMMVGVSHLSTAGVMHAAEISKAPIVSTHQNLEQYVRSRPPVEITDEEARAIAKTGGIVGVRYIPNQATYKVLADEVEYLCKLIGPEHIGVGWLGHDKANPAGRLVEDNITRTSTGVEGQTILEHYDTFIKMLSERGLTDNQINLILGGNYLRIWKQILPDAS
jgi:membrane dipeptidase